MSKKDNTIYVIGGGKGGVGKSMVSLALVDALQRANKKVLMVESDDSNPDVYKTLSETVQCEICNLDNEAGYMKLGGIVESNADSYIVVNTAARATDNIIKHIGIIGDVKREQKRDLVLLWPINRQRDSLELLKGAMDKTTDFDQVHVVINTYYGTPDKFARYDSSKLKTRVNGTIVFPELNDLLADKLDDWRMAASKAAISPEFTIAERSVLTRYREAASNALGCLYGH